MSIYICDANGEAIADIQNPRHSLRLEMCEKMVRDGEMNREQMIEFMKELLTVEVNL